MFRLSARESQQKGAPKLRVKTQLTQSSHFCQFCQWHRGQDSRTDKTKKSRSKKRIWMEASQSKLEQNSKVRNSSRRNYIVQKLCMIIYFSTMIRILWVSMPNTQSIKCKYKIFWGLLQRLQHPQEVIQSYRRYQFDHIFDIY